MSEPRDPYGPTLPEDCRGKHRKQLGFIPHGSLSAGGQGEVSDLLHKPARRYADAYEPQPPLQPPSEPRRRGFNPPPNWPAPPPGWTPPPGWAPDPSWPPPPAGWPLWLADPVPGDFPGSAIGACAGMPRGRRRRKIWPGIAAATVAAALASGGLVYFIRPTTTASKPVGAVASAPVPGPSAPSPPPTSRTAAASLSSPGSGQAAAQPGERGTPETNPLLAKKYAEQSVGNCLETAWSNDGYATMFDRYLGNGQVQFSTGTSSSPTGNIAADTLIYVRVDADGSVTGVPAGGAGGPPTGPADSELDYWGCHPGNQTPLHPTQRPPAGLQAAGVLRVGCTVTYNDYSEPDGATVTMYNPSDSPVTVNDFGIEWGSNGILLSETGPVTDGNTIYPGEIARSWVSGAPQSANSCVIAGWG